MADTEKKLRNELSAVIQARQAKEEESIRNVVGQLEPREEGENPVDSLKSQLREALET
jgi:hypothetical protein